MTYIFLLTLKTPNADRKEITFYIDEHIYLGPYILRYDLGFALISSDIAKHCILNPYYLATIGRSYVAVSNHYNDVMMDAMAFQTTRLTIVYSTVYSGADQRKH